jgi:hypothetical protein
MKAGVEQLEGRDLAAHLVVVDPTPDVAIPGQTLRAFCNTLPPLDGRGQTWALKVIVHRLTEIVGPLGSRVVIGEGPEWLARGRRDPSLLVSVVNIGGFSSGDSLFGQVQRVAPVETNIEGNCWVFSGSVARWGWKGRDFCTTVAATAAHEVGHLLGEGHNVGPAPLSIMTATVNVRPDAVIEETPRPMLQYRANGSQFIATVSAANEWRASARGQKTVG